MHQLVSVSHLGSLFSLFVPHFQASLPPASPPSECARFLHGDLLRGFWLDKDVLCLFSLFRQQRGPWCECDSAGWFSPLNGFMKRMGCRLWLAAGCRSEDPLYAWYWMETMSFSAGALDTWQHAGCLRGGNLARKPVGTDFLQIKNSRFSVAHTCKCAPTKAFSKMSNPLP